MTEYDSTPRFCIFDDLALKALVGRFCEVTCCDEDCRGVEGCKLSRCDICIGGFVDGSSGFEVGEKMVVHFILETLFTDANYEDDRFGVVS